ncbi:MAG: DUF4105 domain-containing protein [Nanoarchaeota archaeon]|nr:DUF4105 domain-containing protein [Nanoarchaeota archaeon]
MNLKFFNKFRKTKIIILSVLFVFLVYVIWLKIPTASNDRDWAVDQSILPYGVIDEGFVTLYNIRNFSYNSKTDYTVDYYNKTFDLELLDSLWYLVEPFSDFQGAAHTFLSFGFGDEYVVLSVEIRKEKGEKFSPVRALFKQYELMYVFGSEEDIIQLRSNYRLDDVFLYPVKTTKERMKIVFIDAVNRANELSENPEYYHSITNTCMTNLVDHTNAVVPGRVPFLKLGIFMPGYSDKLAYELGILDTDLSYEEIRDYYRINEQAMDINSSVSFSKRIRIFGD